MKTYLMYDGKYFKIGKSNNPEKRLSQIKTANPDCMILKTSNKNIEEYLHKKYIKHRYKGEWFWITKSKIISELLSEFDVEHLSLREFIRSLSNYRIDFEEFLERGIDAKFKKKEEKKDSSELDEFFNDF